MPVIVGTERISAQQKDYLRSAKEEQETTTVLRGLYEVATDSDIKRGDEDLHPDWIPLYALIKDQLKQLLPPNARKEVEAFFEAIPGVDPGIASVDPDNAKLIFLLGAGASKPNPSGIPTVRELLPDLLQRGKRLDRDELTKLARFCEESRIGNIEDLLTAAQLSEFCSRNAKILSLVEFLLFGEPGTEELGPRRRRRLPTDISSIALLQDTLQVLFGLLSSRMLPAEPNAAHNAIAKYLQVHADAAIVTTNYDCCMDRALSAASLPFTYGVDFANLDDSQEVSGTKLIKLHGSLNWFYCETCQEVHKIDIEVTVREYQKDRGLYPIIAVCKTCGGQRRGLLVPPLAMKFDLAPPLNPLIDQAAAAFQKATAFVVAGFSFAEADLYISRMLSKAMQASNNNVMLVFDPDRAVIQRVRRKFSIRIPNFDDARIISVIGDCAEHLPAFLNGGFKGTVKPDESTAPGPRRRSQRPTD